MKEKIDIQFQLKNIELVEVNLTPPKALEQQSKTFNYNIGIEHRIIEDKKMLHNIVSIGVHGDDKEHLLGKLKVAISFEINNFSDLVKDKKAKIPEEMLSLFNSIAISTTRGIMFSQFRGTYLHNAILPIIDPNSFRKE